MKNIPALKGVSVSILRDMLGETRFVYEHDETPEHVKHAAAVLMNFYGAELDARMSAKVEGK